MMFELAVKCPLCERQAEHQIRIPAKEGAFKLTGIDEIIYIFCGCGLFYHWFAMTPETLAKYYKNQYRKTLGASGVTERNVAGETARADVILEFIDAIPSNVLDIGSSAGLLLKKLQDAYKCDVVGIEPYDTFREYSHNLGLNVLSKIEYLNGKQGFDLITAIHVLEHQVEPMAFLGKVRELMTEDGRLIVEVPLLNYGLPHPIMFTEVTLKMMLEKAGFAIGRLVVDKHARVEAYIDT